MSLMRIRLTEALPQTPVRVIREPTYVVKIDRQGVIESRPTRSPLSARDVFDELRLEWDPVTKVWINRDKDVCAWVERQ